MAAPESLELEDHVSPQLVCPISHRLMDQPVTAPSGHSYDFKSIVAWLDRRAVDPLNQKPLDPESLYPNRALRDELVEQLERLLQAAKERNPELAEIARQKLQEVEAAGVAPVQGNRTRPGLVTPHNQSLFKCATATIWCGTLASKQVLIFGTSFGCLISLGVDAVDFLLKRRPPAVSHGSSVPGHFHMVASFVQLALLPTAVVPTHWRWLERAAVVLLRTSLLLPILALTSSVFAGCCLSSLQFLRLCRGRWMVEQERAAQSPGFAGALHVCASVIGFCSMGIFTRLYWDVPAG
mmetsp:Transcript_38823/g.91311  ORF Transcript_38823/g.91311 Transcript_38823/m.91311 type:complete len:295 (-) Transcript_38823:4-888(-)